jgi:hypothetical protein
MLVLTVARVYRHQNLVTKYIKVMFSFLIIELKMFGIIHSLLRTLEVKCSMQQLNELEQFNKVYKKHATN